jgi:hypothetical protein
MTAPLESMAVTAKLPWVEDSCEAAGEAASNPASSNRIKRTRRPAAEPDEAIF